MGGDRAPGEVVRGAAAAAASDPNLHLFLVGQEDKVRRELDAASWSGSNIDVVHADHVISMSDRPVDALRKKRGSSIETATMMVKQGEAGAFVSAGNTGACVAASTMFLGLLPNVRRAGIAVVMPAGDQPVVVIDAGANVSPKVINLIQYGIMASHYCAEVLQVPEPKVGLLNVGEEGAKGNSLAKEAHTEFVATKVNYIGNVEGGDVFSGGCDVVVCDGFVGNVLLKVSEGLAEHMMGIFRGVLERFAGDFLGGDQQVPSSAAGTSDMQQRMSQVVGGLRQQFDYAEYGGAPLLGVNGVTIIAHGRSDSRAIANAILVARKLVAADFNQRITDALEPFATTKNGA